MPSVMSFLRPAQPGPRAAIAFALAAVAIGVAGYYHGKLWNQGYSDVHVVGPLFFLNVIGSAAVILLLLGDRPVLFALGSLSISGGAIVSILISHQSRFFRFAEQGYSTEATVIVVAEAAAALLTVVGVALARRRLFPPAPTAPATTEVPR